MEKIISITIDSEKFVFHDNVIFGFKDIKFNIAVLLIIVINKRIEYLFCHNDFIHDLYNTVNIESIIKGFELQMMYSDNTGNLNPTDLAILIRKISKFMTDIKDENKFMFTYDGHVLEQLSKEDVNEEFEIIDYTN